MRAGVGAGAGQLVAVIREGNDDRQDVVVCYMCDFFKLSSQNVITSSRAAKLYKRIDLYTERKTSSQ